MRAEHSCQINTVKLPWTALLSRAIQMYTVIVIVIVIVKFPPNPLWKTVCPNNNKKNNNDDDTMSSSDMDQFLI